MKTVIRLERLTKYYGKHLGVADLNLEVKSGELRSPFSSLSRG